MKVAIFFDGKNFYSGWRERLPGRRIIFPKLASWLVQRAGGNMLVGAHYYTGIDVNAHGSEDGQSALLRFLEFLELQPGFFVYRFQRQPRFYRCSSCAMENRFFQEKEVDTTMVADMLRLAAVSAFDVAVLISGDADHAPALDGLRSLGKIAMVASWGGTGLAQRLRRAAFDHIDLLEGIAEFEDMRSAMVPPLTSAAMLSAPQSGTVATGASLTATGAGALGAPTTPGSGAPPVSATLASALSAPLPPAEPAPLTEESLLEALSIAQQMHLESSSDGIDREWFLRQFRMPRLSEDVTAREELLNQLITAGKVQASEDRGRALLRLAS